MWMTNPGEIRMTPESAIDPELVALCKSIVAKRARTVIDHILQHGWITNEDLSELYQYDHPPRAVRDVREHGIPLVTHRIVSSKTGRQIGAYTFGSLKEIQRGRIEGRRAFSKQFKKDLIKKYGCRDAFTGEPLSERYLQIDHRVPYEIAGDKSTLDPADFMLIDASTQRAKSWSCENCHNLVSIRNLQTCQTCFWASPEAYKHVATKPTRRVDIVWTGSETSEFDAATEKSRRLGLDVREYIKRLLRE